MKVAVTPYSTPSIVIFFLKTESTYARFTNVNASLIANDNDWFFH